MLQPLTTNQRNANGWGSYWKAILSIMLFFVFSGITVYQKSQKPPIYVAFLWQLSEPPRPVDNLTSAPADNADINPLLKEIVDSNKDLFTSWIPGLLKNPSGNDSHFGMQVSISGSLIQNLDNLEKNGDKNLSKWKSYWLKTKSLKTSEKDPKTDFLGTGYFQTPMPLLDNFVLRHQIARQKLMMKTNFPGFSSKGFFPPEGAFSQAMIPMLSEEGYHWVIINQLRLERAAEGYPYSKDEKRIEPNQADIQNTDPLDWITFGNRQPLTPLSALWAHQPHIMEYRDPESGISTKIIGVPSFFISGSENQNFNLDTENVQKLFNQLEPYNVDAKHPMLVVFSVNLLSINRDSAAIRDLIKSLNHHPQKYIVSTIQDYLSQFPPDKNDLVHIEDGPWGYTFNNGPSKNIPQPISSDSVNSTAFLHALITKAENDVETAGQIAPSEKNYNRSLNFLLASESGHFFVPIHLNNDTWVSTPFQAADQAISMSEKLINKSKDETPPSIFLPQRKPYNPGTFDFGKPQSPDFTVRTFAFDVSGLKEVNLYYRTESDSSNSYNKTLNLSYFTDPDSWTSMAMQPENFPLAANHNSFNIARAYSATISGTDPAFVDYYVEAIDSLGNVGRSVIQRVWVGNNSNEKALASVNKTPIVTILPKNPTRADTLEIHIQNYHQSAVLKWGVNNVNGTWTQPDKSYIPNGSTFMSNKNSVVLTPFVSSGINDNLTVSLGPFDKSGQLVNDVDFSIQYQTADSLNNKDYHIYYRDSNGLPDPYTMDTKLDTLAHSVAFNKDQNLYMDCNGQYLYVATESAFKRNADIFVFISDSMRSLQPAPQMKNGKVAGWSAYLFNKSSDNSTEWFGNRGYIASSAGNNLLEGVIDLKAQFGSIPQHLYVSVAAYKPQKGGRLIDQIPDGNGNQNIESAEFYSYDYVNVVTNIDSGSKQPDQFVLQQNYPNPFNPVTQISYSIPKQVRVTLSVYNLLGQKVATIIDKYQSAGTYDVIFDASKLTSGVYFYRLKAGDYVETRSMTVLK